MSTNSLMLVNRPSPFQQVRAQRVVRNEASPILVQTLMQNLSDLNRKLDALAVRSVQVPQAIEAEEAKDATVSRVDRRRLTEIFD